MCSGCEGQLGHGGTENRTSPAPISREKFGGSGVNFVACGRDYSCGITEGRDDVGLSGAGGDLYSWGNNVQGVLG